MTVNGVKPAGARGAHEIGGKHRKHRGARHARDRREREDAEREAGRTSWLDAARKASKIAGDQAVDQIEAGDLRRRREEHVEPAERRRRPAEQDNRRHRPGSAR